MNAGTRRAGLFIVGAVVVLALALVVGCAPPAATSVQPVETPVLQSLERAVESASSAVPALPHSLEEVVAESSTASPALPPASDSASESAALEFSGASPASSPVVQAAAPSSSANLGTGVSVSNQVPVPSSASAAAASVATHRAQIDFGAPVGDAHLQTLLDRHGAKMVVAYMTTAGFFGAHRAATSTAPALFIASARAETVSGFTNGAGGGMTTRARDFVGEHSSADVMGDADVRKRAESLLDLHRRLESARSNAAGGSALIHAVEVHGIESRLRLLGAEDGVVGFEIAEIGSDAHWTRPPLAGGASGSSGAGGVSGASDDGQALYDRLSTLADREIEDGE